MRPANTLQAQQQMKKLLGKKIPGRRATKVKEHRKRALQIADTLYQHFQVGPYQYRLSHILWYLSTHTQPLTPASQYRHWLTIRIIVKGLNRWVAWRQQLEGLWQRPSVIEGQ